MSTAACTSSITYIDGDRSSCIGYLIEQLAVSCDFLEVCYLLKGELPNATQKSELVSMVTSHGA